MKRSIKDKLYFIAFGKYPDAKKEDDQSEEDETILSEEEISDDDSLDEEKVETTEEKTENTETRISAKKINKKQSSIKTKKTASDTQANTKPVTKKQKAVSGITSMVKSIDTDALIKKAKSKLSKNKNKDEKGEDEEKENHNNQKHENTDENLSEDSVQKIKKTTKLSQKKKTASTDEIGEHSGKKQLLHAGKKLTAGMKNLSVDPETLSDEGLPLEDDIEDDERVFAGISYFPFLCFFTLSTRKESPFVMYHSWQSFALLAIVLGTLPLYFLLGWIFVFALLFWFIYVIIFGISFFAAFMAWTGRYVHIPIISDLAKQLSGR